ncbi:MAG: MBL fold metallo-hydrolase [Acidimicrobiia bacterium]|nr:MBL fold metallo-hydrolase [Acidimicrobiia bacterium]
MSDIACIVLGSGSAVPDPDRGNPSQCIRIHDEVLLFDCGERTTINLIKAGIDPRGVDTLFFTHLHWDHIVDFGYFVMTTWNCGRRVPLRVYGPPGTKAMVEACVFGMHRTDVEYVRRYVAALPTHVTERPLSEPPLAVEEIDVGGIVRTRYGIVTAGAVEHHQRVGTPSVGFRVETPAGVVALSGDTRPCQAMIDLARGADVLVHDTAFLDEIIEARQMWSHSGPTGAGRVAQAAGVKTLVLTHLGPYTSCATAVEMGSMYYGVRRDPSIWEAIVAAAQREFDGEVLLGRDGLVIPLPRERADPC